MVIGCISCRRRNATSRLRFQRGGKTHETWPVCVECALQITRYGAGIDRELKMRIQRGVR